MASSKNPDLPYGDSIRTLHVTAEGKPLRGPEPGSFIAVPPLLDIQVGGRHHHMFGGTIPEFRPDRSKTARENEQARLAYQTEELRNREVLVKAILNLSQPLPNGVESDGMRLLRMAYEKKFKFVFDRRTTEARGAVGLCDYENKLIPLLPPDAEGAKDVRRVAQLTHTLKHELQHMEDFACGAGYNYMVSLRAINASSRALEGSARLSQAVLVVENYTIQSGGNTHYYKPLGIREVFEQKLPHMARATNAFIAENTRVDNQKEPWRISLARKVFPEFLKETALIYYDQGAITYLAENLPQTRSSSFTNDLARFAANDAPVQEKLTGALRTGGLPFLKETGVDIDAASFSAIVDNTETGIAYRKLQASVAGLIAGHTEKPLIDLPFISELDASKIGVVKLMVKKFKDAFGRPAARLADRVGVTATGVPVVPDRFAVIVMPHANSADFYHNPKFPLTNFAEAVLRAQQIPGGSSRAAVENLQLAMTVGGNHRNASGKPAVTASRALIDLGFRAPIAAFPADYLMDLRERITHGGKTAASAGDNLFSTGETRLIQHWQDMGARGIDALGGDQKIDGSMMPLDVLAHGRVILAAIAVASPTAQMSATAPSYEDMAAWSKATLARYAGTGEPGSDFTGRPAALRQKP